MSRRTALVSILVLAPISCGAEPRRLERPDEPDAAGARPRADAGALVVNAGETDRRPADITDPDARASGDPGAPPPDAVDAGEAETRARDSASPERAPAIAMPFGRIYHGVWHVCWIASDGKTGCDGKLNNARRPPPPEAKLTAVAAGHHFTCGIAGGAAECWGASVAKEIPAKVEDPIQITVGDMHACLLGRDGRVGCWGMWGKEHTPPAGKRFLRLSSVGAYTCGIELGGALSWWGIAPPKQYPEGEKVKRVALGSDAPPWAEIPNGGSHPHGCVVKADDSVSCWPDDGSAIAKVPAGLKAKEVGVMKDMACAIDLSDDVICWGGSGPGRLKARYLVMNNVSGTAVKADGTVVSWGQADRGGAVPSNVRVAVE
jgi:hypothetical protein